MILSLLALSASSAFAADPPGGIVSTELRAARGVVYPEILVGLTVDPPNPDADPPQPDADPPDPDSEPPQPDLETDGRTAWSTLPYSGEADVSVIIGVAEAELGVRQMYYRPDDRSDPVVVYGEGAVERFYPPDPCVDGELPPGPCFELIAVLGDGTELGVSITVTTEGGFIDPGSLVGFNPQPDPPGFPAAIQMDLSAYARGGAAITVEIAVESGGEALSLR